MRSACGVLQGHFVGTKPKKRPLHSGLANSRFHGLVFGINSLRSDEMPYFGASHGCLGTFVQLLCNQFSTEIAAVYANIPRRMARGSRLLSSRFAPTNASLLAPGSRQPELAHRVVVETQRKRVGRVGHGRRHRDFRQLPRTAPPPLGRLMDGREPLLSSERGAGAANIVPTRTPGADASPGSIFASPPRAWITLIVDLLDVPTETRQQKCLSTSRSRFALHATSDAGEQVRPSLRGKQRLLPYF